jgi:hypothetical protein
MSAEPFRTRIDELPENHSLRITCGQISPRLGEFAVWTTKRLLMDLHERLANEPIEERRRTLLLVKHNIVKYSNAELDAMFHAKNAKWQDWCTGVGLYASYCARLDIKFVIDAFSNDDVPDHMRDMMPH